MSRYDFKPVPNGFRNQTELEVPEEVALILSYGPKFIVPKRFGLEEYAALQFLVCRKFRERHGELLVGRDELGDCLGRIKEIAGGSGGVSRIDAELIRMASRTMKFLRDTPGIRVVQADKGAVTILMYEDDYNQKMQAILDKGLEAGVYSEVLGGMALRIRALRTTFCFLRRRLNELWKGSCGDPEIKKLVKELKGLQVATVSLPYMYGMVKLHKPGAPCRPIVSSLHWFSPVVQKILNSCFKVFRLELPYNLRRISDLPGMLDGVCFVEGYEFLKVDIVDMFTRIPREGLRRELEVMLENAENQLLLPQGFVRRLLSFDFGELSYMTFNGRTYKQEKGLPQGGCNSTLYAELYVDARMKRMKEEMASRFSVTFFTKFVDDFLFYLPPGKVPDFLVWFQEELGLEIASESESVYEGNRGMSYLGYFIVREVSCASFVYRLFRKPFSSRRLVHYRSNHTSANKKAACNTLLRRVLLGTSNRFLWTALEEFIETLQINGFPRGWVCDLLGESLSKELVVVKSVERRFLIQHFCCTKSVLLPCVRDQLVEDRGVDIRDLAAVGQTCDVRLTGRIGLNAANEFLKMRWRGFDSTKSLREFLVEVYCRECEEIYFVQGKAENEVLVVAAKLGNESSLFGAHMAREGHNVAWDRLTILRRPGHGNLKDYLGIRKILSELKGIPYHIERGRISHTVCDQQIELEAFFPVEDNFIDSGVLGVNSVLNHSNELGVRDYFENEGSLLTSGVRGPNDHNYLGVVNVGTDQDTIVGEGAEYSDSQVLLVMEALDTKDVNDVNVVDGTNVGSKFKRILEDNVDDEPKVTRIVGVPRMVRATQTMEGSRSMGMSATMEVTGNNAAGPIGRFSLNKGLSGAARLLDNGEDYIASQARKRCYKNSQKLKRKAIRMRKKRQRLELEDAIVGEGAEYSDSQVLQVMEALDTKDVNDVNVVDGTNVRSKFKRILGDNVDDEPKVTRIVGVPPMVRETQTMEGSRSATMEVTGNNAAGPIGGISLNVTGNIAAEPIGRISLNEGPSGAAQLLDNSQTGSKALL